MMRIIPAAMLLFCGACQASDWVSVWKSDDGTTESFVDAANIKVEGEIRTAKLKHVSQHHTERGLGENANKWVDYQLSSGSFDCVKQVIREESNVVYYDDGTVQRYDNPMLEQLGVPEPWVPLPDDPLAKALMQFICEYKQ
jgi:hypothetical protein